MPLNTNTELDLGPGHIVLDGAQLPQKGAQQPPSLRPMSIVAKRSPISATTELLLYNRKTNMTFENKLGQKGRFWQISMTCLIFAHYNATFLALPKSSLEVKQT